ncbi:MAG: 2-oxoacid:acceptor oxidoreductase family protein [Desulfocapsaceae bacterium]|nr:2-oxoacid:acceptor oxidoreductase family protein [Desulfocapsaceae bacterium]
MKHTSLVLTGSGGQGVITAAIILAEAAVIHEGMNATQTQSYGAAARGGSTRADIIISGSPIFFPGVSQPNILVCLTQEAYTEFSSIIRPGGILLTDSRFVTLAKKVDANQIQLPLYDTVMEKIGKPIVFNICLLGALLGINAIVRPESVMEVIKTRVPADFVAMNNRALDIGLVLGANRETGRSLPADG